MLIVIWSNEVNNRENFDEISIASVPKSKGGAEEIFEGLCRQCSFNW